MLYIYILYIQTDGDGDIWDSILWSKQTCGSFHVQLLVHHQGNNYTVDVFLGWLNLVAKELSSCIHEKPLFSKVVFFPPKKWPEHVWVKHKHALYLYICAGRKSSLDPRVLYCCVKGFNSPSLPMRTRFSCIFRGLFRPYLEGSKKNDKTLVVPWVLSHWGSKGRVYIVTF